MTQTLRIHLALVSAGLRGELQYRANFVIWIVVGLVVASNKGFLSHLDSLSGVLSAALAVLVWPLVLLEVHFGI